MDVTYLLDAKLPDDGWLQIAKLGKFRDARYGRFGIDKQTVASWIKNLTHAAGGTVAIDYDHAADEHANPSTKAAGWVTAIRLDGERVLAKIDWTPQGRASIESGEYRFFSPTFVDHWRDEQGNDLGASLLGVALTNRPFLRRDMPAISLAEGDPFAATDDDDPAESQPADSPAQMDRKKLTQKLGLAEDATDEQIEAKLTEQAAQAEKATTLEAAADDKRTLAQRAADDGKALVDVDELKKLQDGAAAGEASAEELRTMRFETAFGTALTEGRIAPAQKDTVKALFDSDEANAIKLLAESPKLVNTTERGHTGNEGEGATDPTGEFVDQANPDLAVDPDGLRLHNEAIAHERAGKTYAEGIRLAEQGVKAAA